MQDSEKVWTTGDLVNASDFNNYLQEQVIGGFDSATQETHKLHLLKKVCLLF